MKIVSMVRMKAMAHSQLSKNQKNHSHPACYFDHPPLPPSRYSDTHMDYLITKSKHHKDNAPVIQAPRFPYAPTIQ
ncbi:hypothetical protein L6452_10480 [Arctium lappa]|uniref:Uncharacterized protein n=1 Tax=Arctium lappa TaxID=4217 RepID=A0ACB9DMQ1_ARCLA|nr:hypothetical protein L6452_10480 [Arctium lappa]